MAKPLITMECGLCSSEFHFGAHRGGGKYLPRYGLTVCSACYDANGDGWGPAHERRLLSHLDAQGLGVPVRTGKGSLPRE